MPTAAKTKAQSKFALRMTTSLSKEAKDLAAKEGVSLNQFINLAIAEKVEYLENEAWIARRRPMTQGRLEEALALLNRFGTLPPQPGDEVPESFKKWRRAQERRPRKTES